MKREKHLYRSPVSRELLLVASKDEAICATSALRPIAKFSATYQKEWTLEISILFGAVGVKQTFRATIQRSPQS